MTLYDANTERTYTLHDLKRDWRTFRSEDPHNHAACFRTELFEILMATVNGRNDCDVVGMTPNELTNYISALRHDIERSAS